MAEEQNGIDLRDFSTPGDPVDKDITGGAATFPAGLSQEEVENRAILVVPVSIMAVVGAAKMPVKELLRLGRGAIIRLDKKVGESVDVYANGVVIARGELNIVDDNTIAVTMTEVMANNGS